MSTVPILRFSPLPPPFPGWRFVRPDEQVPGTNVRPDPLHPTYTHLRDLYHAADPAYAGRYTVPVLFDSRTDSIVSNESSEIIRMLYYSFHDFIVDPAKKNLDLFPESLRGAIEETNGWTYHDVNNGVYKCGFAT